MLRFLQIHRKDRDDNYELDQDGERIMLPVHREGSSLGDGIQRSNGSLVGERPKRPDEYSDGERAYYAKAAEEEDQLKVRRYGQKIERDAILRAALADAERGAPAPEDAD